MTKGQKKLNEWWEGLKRWEREYFYYSSSISRMLLWQWRQGKAKPSLKNARELELLSKRAVPMLSWLEEEEEDNAKRNGI